MEIHLVVNKLSGVPRLADRDTSTWESGDWSQVTDERAQALIGGTILIFPDHTRAATHGGTILGFRRIVNGPGAGRVVFRYQADPQARGFPNDPEGWSNEKKFVD